MNRQQRRKAQRNKVRFQNWENCTREEKFLITNTGSSESPDFSDVPMAMVCQSIQILINELYRRGYPIYDFDHKEKHVQGIQIIRDKVYFLAAEGDFYEKI